MTMAHDGRDTSAADQPHSAMPLLELSHRYCVQLECALSEARLHSEHWAHDVDMVVTEVESRVVAVRQRAEPFIKATARAWWHAVTQTCAIVPSGSETYERLLEIYMWSAMCLLAIHCTSAIGTLAAPITNLFIHQWAALALAYVLLPLWFYFYNRRDCSRGVSDDERRMQLLYLAMAMGALDAAALPQAESAGHPPMAAMCLVASVAMEYGALRCNGDRMHFFGVVLGSASLVSLVWHCALCGLGGVSPVYLCETLLLAAATYASVQMALAQMHTAQAALGADGTETQLAHIVACVAVRALGTVAMHAVEAVGGAGDHAGHNAAGDSVLVKDDL